MTGTMTSRPGAPGDAKGAPPLALLFAPGGRSDPVGGPDWDSYGVSAWPSRVIWCTPEPYSFGLLVDAAAVLIPGDGVLLCDEQLAVLTQWVDAGGAVVISARSNELIDVAVAAIQRLTGGAGNA